MWRWSAAQPTARHAWERARLGAQALRDDAQFPEPGPFAAGTQRAVRREHLLDQRGPGARRAQDENRLRYVGPQSRARQPRDVRRVEELLHRTVERRDTRGIVGKTARLGRELALAFDEVGPGLLVASAAFPQASALELAVAIQCRRGFDDRKRVRIPARPREVLRAQQVDRGRRRGGLGRVEKALRAREIALHFAQLRPVREDSHRAGRQAIGLRKCRLGFGRAALLHQVEREIRSRGGIRTSQARVRA